MRLTQRAGPLVAVLAVLGLAGAPWVTAAENLAEFIGRSDQNGSAITHYGYVTHVRSLPDADLFFDPANRTETTAKVTYFATTTLDARHAVGNIITTATAPGTLTFFLRTNAGATFSDPSSFATGTPFGVFTIRYQNVLNVQGVNGQGQAIGIASAVADASTQGLLLRITATGEGTLLVNDPANPVSVFFLGGHIVGVP